MARMLADGSVIPHYLGTRQMGAIRSQGQYDSLGLMMGEVKEIVYPDDTKSISKKFVEYTVAVQYRRGADAGATVEFRGCQVMNGLGGFADNAHHTLRPDAQQQQEKGAMGVGTKVLMLCLNGDSSRPIIIGGLRNAQDPGDSRDDGHNSFWEFNGIRFSVNNDGEATIQFNGATKVDGTTDSDAGPTTIQLLKNGNLSISTKDENQRILIDHENKSVRFDFDESWTVGVNGNVVEDYGKAWQVSAGTTISLGAKADLSLMAATGSMSLMSAGGMSLLSSGLSIGSASDAMLKGSTFRKHQRQMNQRMIAGLQDLSQEMGAAGQALLAASALHKIAITGPIVASGLIQTAGQALAKAVNTINGLVASIADFEGQDKRFLSDRNKSD
jgi:hypothetical protein